MSAEPAPEYPGTTEKDDEEVRTPYSTNLARLGRKMRKYGNTMLVLMIVTLLVSIFMFGIVLNPIVGALVIFYLLLAIEIGYFFTFLEHLKLSEIEYGGYYLRQAYYVFLVMVLMQIILALVGTVIVIIKIEELTVHFAPENALVTIFYSYNLFSAEAFWIKIIELTIPILCLFGVILLRKWGNFYVGDRMEEEYHAPFPKEMQLILFGAILYIINLVLGVGINFIPNESTIILIISFFINLLRSAGAVLSAVGFARAGYYLELYTTEDKKKFFSVRQYDDN